MDRRAFSSPGSQSQPTLPIPSTPYAPTHPKNLDTPAILEPEKGGPRPLRPREPAHFADCACRTTRVVSQVPEGGDDVARASGRQRRPQVDVSLSWSGSKRNVGVHADAAGLEARATMAKSN
jgi:hypothetical protein